MGSYLNPWSPLGPPKVFDEDATPSVSFRVYDYHALPKTATTSTTANGFVAAARFFGRVNGHFYYPTVAGTGWTSDGGQSAFPVVAWNNSTNVAQYTTLDTNFDTYRIVSWGVRIIQTGPKLSASGTLYLLTTALKPTVFSTTYNDIVVKKEIIPISGMSEVVWVSKPFDNRAREYRNINESSGDFYAWEELYIYSPDLSEDATFLLESVYNLELLPKVATVTAAMATPAAPDRPDFRRDLSNVREFMPSVLYPTKGVEGLGAEISSIASTIIGKAPAALNAINMLNQGLRALNFAQGAPAA